MEIKITGCKNCIFAPEETLDSLFCTLNPKLEIGIILKEDICNTLRTDIPDNCPIKLSENQQITVKI